MKFVIAVLFPFYISLACTSKKTNNEIVIRGNIVGIQADTVYLTDAYSSKKIDSAIVINNEFIFKISPGSSFEPQLVSIKFYKNDGKRIQLMFKNDLVTPSGGTSAFMLEPGETFITGKIEQIEFNSTNHLNIKGGKETETQFKYERVDFGAMSRNQILNRNAILESYENIIIQNPHSHFLLHKLLLNKRGYDSIELTKMISLFNSEVQKSKYIVEVKDYLKNRKTLNDTFENFSLTSSVGKTSNILDSLNNLNMIVFWASWCGPCRLEIPSLKEINKLFKGKGLNMISISIDKDNKAWKKAIAFEKMPWIQLITDSTTDKKIRHQFDFNSIPVTFFINKNGVIVKRVDDYRQENREVYIEYIKNYLSAK